MCLMHDPNNENEDSLSRYRCDLCLCVMNDGIPKGVLTGQGPVVRVLNHTKEPVTGQRKGAKSPSFTGLSRLSAHIWELLLSESQRYV